MGHWKSNENTGTTTVDASGNVNTGTLTSGAAWATGQSGSAVSFDGANDYVQVGAQSKLVMTSTASFSAWIYPTGAGSDATLGGTILVKEGEYVIARYANGTIRWGFANSNPGWAFVDTGHVAPLNQWTHISITYDNGTIKTYANGTLVHTYSGSGAIGDAITGQNDFRIGGRQVISQHFQGRIDEVRVYNRTLTATEVSGLASGAASSVLAVNWLVADHLGTPRMILDQTGTLANIKRHDYLPFGEELFTPAGGRSTALGYTSGDGIRQQFTSKERDAETGLDYFGARYYSGNQGRFTGTDPYDINIERQQIDDEEEAHTLFNEYIEQPQHWNRYSYTLNNPLKYVDPNGRQEKDIEYERTLLGKPFKIIFSPKIDEPTRMEILANIDRSIDRINTPQHGQLTAEEIKVITSMKGIKVTPDIGYEHMAGDTFMIRPHYGLQDNDGLTASMLHDAHHSYTGRTTSVKEEMKASSFAIGPALKIGLSDKEIQWLCTDAKFGHKPARTNPNKQKQKSNERR